MFAKVTMKVCKNGDINFYEEGRKGVFYYITNEQRENPFWIEHLGQKKWCSPELKEELRKELEG